MLEPFGGSRKGGASAPPFQSRGEKSGLVFQLAPKSPTQAYVALRREVHAAYEVLKARVGAERIKHAPNFEVGD